MTLSQSIYSILSSIVGGIVLIITFFNGKKRGKKEEQAKQNEDTLNEVKKVKKIKNDNRVTTRDDDVKFLSDNKLIKED